MKTRNLKVLILENGEHSSNRETWFADLVLKRYKNGGLKVIKSRY